AANFLSGLGWKRGEPWLQEVRVPDQMAWQEADLAITHTRAEWSRMGVTAASGSLPADNMPASLVLPMGRLGPAFLAYSNFKTAFIGWNAALVYSTTAAYLATRLNGAPQVSRGNGAVQPLTTQEMFELQGYLVKYKFLAADPDGKLGATTREAVR